MRTERSLVFGAVLLASVALAAPAFAAEDGWLAPGRFSAGAQAEVDVVGLAYGVRPEVLYRPFGADGSTHVRLAFGVLPGPEYTFVPIDLGWRQIFRRGDIVQPVVGAGFEEQFYVISDADTVQRPVIYLEGGVDFRIWKAAYLGVHLAPDISAFVRPGFGLATRLAFRWDFGG